MPSKVRYISTRNKHHKVHTPSGTKITRSCCVCDNYLLHKKRQTSVHIGENKPSISIALYKISTMIEKQSSHARPNYVIMLLGYDEISA